MLAFRTAIQPMNPYIPGRSVDEVRKLYQLDEIIKLASNENPNGCSPAVREAFLQGLQNLQTFAEVAVYPDGYCTQLRKAVSKHYNIEGERLIFGAGTDEVIAMLGKIFIEPGDECITGAITFSQYAAATESMGGKMVYAPMKNHGFDLEALLQCITPKTKMIFIANPNNPTGTYFSKDEQTVFMKQVPKNIVVVFDEAYQEYVTASNYPDTWETLRQFPSNVVLLKTFSKIYGLASFRIGFGAACPSIIEQMEKIRCPFNVTAQAQTAACAALADQNFVQESYKQNQQVMTYMVQSLEKMGLYCIPSQANFIMVDVKRDSREVFETLMKKGYIIRPGAAFGMDDFIRITVGTQKQAEGLLEALKKAIE